MQFGRVSGFPGPSGQLPRVGTQFEPDPYEDGLLRKIDPDHEVRLPAGHGGPEPIWSPDAALMDTVHVCSWIWTTCGGIPVSSDTGWSDFTGPPETGGVYVD